MAVLSQARPVPWVPVIAASLATAALAGLLTWRWDLQHIESGIADKRSALKKLTISGGIPPNQQVADYLTGRQAAVEERYRQWQQLVAAPPLPEAAQADPQLYFQEHFHEIQRAVEQLAAARTLPAPELLGFPKDLPPSDTVPRLLVQLELIRESAELVYGQKITGLASLKVEDPETVAEEQGAQPFLVRLPVRIRFTASLPQAMTVLAAIHRAEPLMDVRALRMSPGGSSAPPADSGADEAPAAAAPATDQLDVEVVVTRHVILPPTEEPDAGASAGSAGKGAGSKKGSRKKTPAAKQP